MDSNCNDLVNDVVRIYPLPHGKFFFAAPANIKMASVSEDFIKYASGAEKVAVTDEYLMKQTFFSIYDPSGQNTADGTESCCVVIEESPEVRITPKKSISGLIYSAIMNLTVKEVNSKSQTLTEEMADQQEYDYIICIADGRRYLLRSLDGTSGVDKESSIKKEEEIRMKLSVQSLSSLIPIL